MKTELIDAAINEVAKNSAPEYVYASFLGLGQTPGTWDIEILGEEIENVPRLAGVVGWELLDQINSGSTSSITFNIPDQEIAEIRINMKGWIANPSPDAFIRMRVNDNSSLDYLWGRYTVTAEGTISSSFFEGGTGTASESWVLGRWGVAHSQVLSTHVFTDQVAGGTRPGYYSISGRSASTGAGHTQNFAWGRISNVNTTINSLVIYAQNHSFGGVYASCEVLRSITSGTPLLCVRSKLVPLTVIGVLSGKTV